MTIDARPRPGSIAKVTAFAALALALIALIVITMRRADEPRATDPSEARAPAVATPRFDKPIPAQRQAAGTATYIQVVDAEGRPVPHAGMWEGAADARFSADDPIATGDQRGLLIAPENAAQTGKGRWIWRHGYLATAWNGEARVVLLRGSELALRVIDVQGNPRVHQDVLMSRRDLTIFARPSARADANDLTPNGAPHPSAGAVYVAVTDATGRATMTGLPTGRFLLAMGDPDLHVVSIKGGIAGGGVAVPGPPITVVVEEIIGVRIELRGERIISHAFLSPHGVRLRSTAGDLPDDQGQWIELQGARRLAVEDPSFTLFLDLTRSGPIRLDLALCAKTNPGYVIRHHPEGDHEAATVTFVILDASGRQLDLPVQCSGTVGTSITQLRRKGIAEVDPRELRWGASGRAGNPMSLGPRTYTVQVSAPFVSELIEPRTITCRPGETQDVHLTASRTCQLVEFVYPIQDTAWILKITDDDGTGKARTGRWQFAAGERSKVWLPGGNYRVDAYAPGVSPTHLRIHVDNADAVHELPSRQ